MKLIKIHNSQIAIVNSDYQCLTSDGNVQAPRQHKLLLASIYLKNVSSIS